MIEVHIKDYDVQDTRHIQFHGRDAKGFHIYPNHRTLLPETITITIGKKYRTHGWIQFRGRDCQTLINGLLDSATPYMLRQIQLSIQDRLEEHEN